MRAVPEAARLDVPALRGQFPALESRVAGKRLVYLDNACTALKSRLVAEKMSDFYLRWGGCGGKRSTHLASQQVEEELGAARREIAEFLGAQSPSEIVFTSGTTEAINLVARAFPYEGGRREVVVSELEHNSVFLPFHEASQRGEIRLRFCPAPGGRVDLDALERLVTDKTALVALTRSSNVLGGSLPAAEAARITHRRGACLLVDDAQFLSSHREDVSAANVDFAAFSAHKIGGPFGIGALYGKEHLLNRLGRYKTGGGSVKSVEWDGGAPSARYLDAPMRFEAGVPNIGGILGLAEAARLLSSLPPASVRAHVAGLVRRALRGLEGFPQIRTLGDPEVLEQGSIVAFSPADPRFSLPDFNLFLNHELPDRFIALRVGEHCAHLLHRALGVESSARMSFFAYNTEDEVDSLLDALGSYAREACA